MTYKEAILLSLEDFPNGAGSTEIYNNILTKDIMKFPLSARTPRDTVSSQLVDFIQKHDARVNRFKNEKGVYRYFLTKYSPNYSYKEEDEGGTSVSESNEKSFHERDLHPLLCTYLAAGKNGEEGIVAKTIFHEKSTKAEEHQKWMHPDIIGVQFMKFEDKNCNSLFHAVSKKDTLRMFSYELKKEINNDYELKKCFFQAVSNSSWANYGYLVAFDIDESLRTELGRLNNSFGIGFILLKANPYESEVLFEAKYKSLDFSTINKLCKINKDFATFIKDVEATITADDKYFEASKKELIGKCDTILETESAIKKHCNTHNIPWEE